MIRAAALVALLAASTARAEADPWLGPDKALHFTAGAALAAGGYGGAAIWTDSTRRRLLGGAALALTIGAGKELWDATGRGDPSWRDFAWDGVGAATGLAFAWLVDELLREEEPAASEAR